MGRRSADLRQRREARAERARAEAHLLRTAEERGRLFCRRGDGGFRSQEHVFPETLGNKTLTDQSGWVYRLVEDGPEWVLQVRQDGGWTDMYGFVPLAAERIDIEVNNWYTSTHPGSNFVTGVMAGLRRPDRCLTLYLFEEAVLIERPVGGASSVTEVPIAQVPALLAERFGIPGVVVTDGRLALNTT